MYKVSNTLTGTYGNDMELKPREAPDMPHTTVHNKRMTNVQLSDGDFIHGIRRNHDLGRDQILEKPPAGDEFTSSPVKPLRYTPGLKCDAHLESLRPSRDPKHQAIQGGDQWKKQLIQHPQTYEGSFADADIQKFRPNPNLSPMEDPWYASRIPDPTMIPVDRLAMPPMYNMSPYQQMYPQDELSQIKMRNRRYQNAMNQEMMSLNPPSMMMMHPGYFQPQPQQPMMPMMRGVPMNMPVGPAQPSTAGFDYETAMGELNILDQELNMTRRATRPYVPTGHPGYWGLQRQVQAMEEPIEPVKPPSKDIVSVDQLPAPKPVVKAPLTEAAMPKSNRPEVRIADQIAIRSFVLSDKIPKIGGTRPEPRSPKSPKSPPSPKAAEV